MNKRSRYVWLFASCLLLLSNIANAQTTRDVSGERPSRRLDRVLDYVFVVPIASDLVTSANIRFEPSFANDSQITILRYRNAAKIIYFKAQRNVADLIQDMIAAGKDLPDQDIAHTVGVERREYTISVKRSDQLLNSLFLACSGSLIAMRQLEAKESRSNQVALHLDGTTYQFFSSPKLNKVNLSIYDQEIGKKVSGDFEFTILANSLRLQLENKSFR